ncbi:MAG: DUF1878 family protein [Bacillaceae bacterium]
MNEYEERLKQLEYYISLLVPMVNSKEFPFYFIIVKYKLTKEIEKEILKSCEKINKQYIVEKQEGFVHFEPLLEKFRQTIPSHVPIEELVSALKSQHYYPSLMDEFIKILSKQYKL